MILLIIFALVCIAAIIAMNNQHALFATGLPYMAEDSAVITLSIVGVISTFVEIIKVEHK